MNSRLNRIRFLENSIKENPADPFFPYALAMEHKTNEPSKAIDLLRSLLISHPNYLPTYYSLGSMLIDEGLEEEALKILQTGKSLSQKSGDHKTLREISDLITNLEMEGF